ncbi:MAG: hypothetical protein JWM76_5218 [Pseudonocardiales bacterium]|nr:hypothetical protein [Pseudonocardiales bacterium]
MLIAGHETDHETDHQGGCRHNHPTAPIGQRREDRARGFVTNFIERTI